MICGGVSRHDIWSSMSVIGLQPGRAFQVSSWSSFTKRRLYVFIRQMAVLQQRVDWFRLSV